MPGEPPQPDVTVFGAGPAGLMAAQAAVDAGARVVVHEGMRTAGRKFLVAGKGGLNLTHGEPLPDFLEKYGAARAHLAPFIEAFPPDALRAFAAALGQETFVGTSGRVFPKEKKAAPLLRAWIARLKRQGVTFRTKSRLASLERVAGRATVLALGGASWPETGSDGAWVEMLRGAGVEVADLAPSNVGFEVAWPDGFLAKAEGASLKNVALSFAGATSRGDIAITKYGVEGTPVYRLSASMRDALLRRGGEPPIVTVDLKPDLDAGALATRLAAAMAGGKSRSSALRSGARLDDAALALLATAAKEADAAALAARVKSVPLRITAPRPIAEAISSAGGVRWSAVGPDLMLARLPGVFVAGEMLDWEAPTGGYLLTACFATGRAAGAAAAVWAGVRGSESPKDRRIPLPPKQG